MRHVLLLAIGCLVLACNTQKETASEAPPPPPSPPPVPIAGTAPMYGGDSPADSLFFSIERTPCFGRCKAYRIDVYRSGLAVYNGRMNMEKQGMHNTFVPFSLMDSLYAHADHLGFFGMNDKYDADVTDLPSTFIHVVARGKNKQVIGRVGQPIAFKDLAEYAEEQLLPLPWMPVQH